MLNLPDVPTMRAIRGVVSRFLIAVTVFQYIFVAAPLAKATGDFQRIDSLALEAPDDRGITTLVDPVNDFSYVGLCTAPAQIVKVDNSTTAVVDVVQAPIGIDCARSGAIDVADGFAYFGTATFPGHVIKVDLGTFGISSVLTPGVSFNNFISAGIDPGNGYLYIGTDAAPAEILKIDLATFTHVDDITLAAGEESASTMVVDDVNGFLYSAASTTPTDVWVVKVDLSTFTRTGAISTSATTSFLGSAIDVAGGKAYFIAQTGTDVVIEVTLSSFTETDTLSLGAYSPLDAVVDTAGGYLYVTINDTPGRVAKVDLTGLTLDSTLPITYDYSWGIDVDETDGYLMVSTDSYPSSATKIDLASFTVDSDVQFTDYVENGLQSAVIDTANGFAYYGTDTQPGNIVKVDLATMTKVATLTLNAGEDELHTAVIDTANGFAYFGTSTVPGIVVKVDLSTFTRVGAVTLDPGEDYLESSVIDAANGFAYFGTATSPGQLVKVDLSPFQRDSAVTFGGEGDALSAVLDAANGDIYVGTGDAPANVVRIDTGTFTQTGTLALSAGADNAESAVIDAANGKLYFGTNSFPAMVSKVDIAGFSEDAAITLSVNAVHSGVFDSVNGHLFYGSGASNVIRVETAGFTEDDYADVLPDESDLYSAVIDEAAGYAYFGTDTTPGHVIQMQLFLAGTGDVNGTDTMSRQKASTGSTHGIALTLGAAPSSGTVILTYADNGGSSFNFTGATIVDAGGDCTATGLTGGNGTITVTITAGGACDATGDTVEFNVTSAVTNSSAVGSHTVSVSGTAGLTGSFAIPITAEDQITVTAAVDPYVTFDLEASGTSCASGTSGSSTDHVPNADTYAVALGTLSPAAVKSSQNSGGIEHICTTVSTNASGGYSVSVRSLNGGLYNGSQYINANATETPDATDAAQTLSGGTEGYGLCLSTVTVPDMDNTLPAGTNLAGSGNFAPGTCDDTSADVAQLTTNTQTIGSGAGPVQEGTAQWMVKASIAATTGAGSYSDTLTFVATGTF